MNVLIFSLLSDMACFYLQIIDLINFNISFSYENIMYELFYQKGICLLFFPVHRLKEGQVAGDAGGGNSEDWGIIVQEKVELWIFCLWKKIQCINMIITQWTFSVLPEN